MLDARAQTDFARGVASSSYELEAIGGRPISVVESVVEEIDELLSLNDPEVMAKRAQHFAVADTTAGDYSENFYLLENGHRVLAGIRHLSSDPAHPFVHFVLPFVPSAQDIQFLAQVSRRKFSKFAPKYFSFLSRPSLGMADVGRDLAAGRHVVAGRVAGLREAPATGTMSRISFEPFDFENGMTWYRQSYTDFHSANPSLSSWVPITDEDDLRSCARDGWIFQVRVDGQRAGLVAAERKKCIGDSGAYMMELLLVPPFKGQGLASEIQRKFIDVLPPDIELVWGTIDAKNQASLKTALRVGRTVIRTEYFMELGI